MKNGIDRPELWKGLLAGKRVGLITSASGLAADFRPSIDHLHENARLAALFAPEHGVRGDKAAGGVVEDTVDPKTGVPVYSLYRRDGKRLTPALLETADVFVYDIQDVGARYYTFLYTMLYALEDCARAGKPFVVLDRADPLDGVTVEGNVLQEGFGSFVGGYPLAMRYGLTIGEFARMADDRLGLGAALTVVPLEGWERRMLWPEAGRCWVPPTMGIPAFDTALLYPGFCLFEGTNLSEGRGTTRPFATVGAPFLDSAALAQAMNAKKLPGVAFTPACFTPSASKFQGEFCQGVQAHVTAPHELEPVRTALTLLYEIFARYESAAFLPPVREGGRPFLELLCGSDALTRRRPPLPELLGEFAEESRRFAEDKKNYHIYR